MMPVRPRGAGLIAASLFGSHHATPIERLARLVIAAIVIGIGVSTVVLAVAELPMGDLQVYLAAAERLASGRPLYDSTAEPFNAYWYSPWLAAAFIPATVVAYPIVVVVWLLLLLAACALVIVRLSMLGPIGLLSAGLFGPLLIAVACGGNVQPLLIAALVHRIGKRDGPLWIGLGASLKVTPILFVLVLISERRWRAAGVAVIVAALLWIPALPLGFTTGGLADWERYAPSLFGISVIGYGAAVLAACLLIFACPSRIRWLVAAAATVLALPRLFAYDVTLVAAGLADVRPLARSRNVAPADAPIEPRR